MAVKLKNDFAAEQKTWVKRAMKGRDLYFGLQAQAAKKGKLILSKKPGLVKPVEVKKLAPYEGGPRDKEADIKKKNELPGSPSAGVCKGENGVLKLYFEKGKSLPVFEKFVRHFITKELKFKAVKRVEIVEQETLPTVDENATETAATTESVTLEHGQLETQLSTLKLPAAVKSKLEAFLTSAKSKFTGNPEDADNDLMAFKATLALVKDLQALLMRATAIKTELDNAKKAGKLTDTQHQMESLNSEALSKLTSALNAVAATDEDVEASAGDELVAAKKLVEQAEALKSGTTVPVESAPEALDFSRLDFKGQWAALEPRMQKLTAAYEAVKLRGALSEESGTKIELIFEKVEEILGGKDKTWELLEFVQKAHTQVETLLKDALAGGSPSTESGPLGEAIEAWAMTSKSSLEKLKKLQIACRYIEQKSAAFGVRKAASQVNTLLLKPLAILETAPPSNKKTVEALANYISNSQTLTDAERAAPKLNLECAIRPDLLEKLRLLKDALPS